MLHYYHMTSADGSGNLPDTYGDEREDIQAVATETARAMVDAGSGDEDWTGWILSVCSENGKEIAAYPVDELLEVQG